MKRVSIVQHGIDRVVIGFFNHGNIVLHRELRKESLGFQHQKPIRESNSKTWKSGFHFYNNLEGAHRPKELIIHFHRKDKSPFKPKGMLQFVSTRWDIWTPEQIERVIERLSSHLVVEFRNFYRIEYYTDLANHPNLQGWSIAFSKKFARSTSPVRPDEGGYREGKLKGGRGSEGKTYPKTEWFFAHRLEVVLGRHKLIKNWESKTLGQTLRLDPFAVLCREGHFIAVRESDWPRIIRKPNKCRRIMRGFKKRGPVWVCRKPNKREQKWFHSLTERDQRKHFSLITKREAKRFHKLKVKLAVHQAVLAPGEIDE